MIDTYTVRLEKVFHGPMDLLLHLVREQEVEIHEIEISHVIEGFLAYLGSVKDLDIEVAGDFVVMAATLMSIKSRSLLPREEIDLEKELDPRDELIQRLMEYRRFHDAAANLGGLHDLRARSFARGAGSEEEDREAPVLELGDLTAWDLLAQFSRLLRETQAGRPHHVAADGKPLRFYVDELAKRIRELGEVSLRSLLAHFEPERSRESLVGSFCAVLELVKLGLVSVEQEGPKSDLVLRLRPEHAADIESVLRASLFDDEIAEPSGDPAASARIEPAAERFEPADDWTEPAAEKDSESSSETAPSPETAAEATPESMSVDLRSMSVDLP